MKKYFLLFIFISLALAPAALVILVDPYKYFSQGFFKQEHMIKHEVRMQSPGIIQNYIGATQEFNTVVMGGSLAQNFKLERQNDAFTSLERGINLAFSGARPVEQITVMESVLSTGKIDKVYWVVGPTWRFSPTEGHQRLTFPHFLYNDDIFDDLNYIYSFKAFQTSIRFILTIIAENLKIENIGKLGLEFSSIEEFAAWAPFSEDAMDRMNESFLTEPSRVEVAKLLKQTEETLQDGRLIIQDYDRSSSNAFVSERKLLAKTLEQNPDTKFVLIYPPVPAVYYHTISLDEATTVINRPYVLADFAERFDNVSAYGITDDFIINDIRYYKDRGHYDHRVSRYILNQIASGKGELTTLSVGVFVERLKQSINNFDRSNPFKLPAYPRKLDFNGFLGG